MMAEYSKASLSVAQKWLLELMQSINFGRIEGLSVRSGQPVIDCGPRVVREIKFGGENDPRPERSRTDFLLKSQVVELFQHFDQLGNGTIELLEVKHGLPFRMTIAQA